MSCSNAKPELPILLQERGMRHLSGLGEAHEEADPVGVVEQKLSGEQFIQQAAQRPHVGGGASALTAAPVKAVAVRALRVADQ